MQSRHGGFVIPWCGLSAFGCKIEGDFELEVRGCDGIVSDCNESGSRDEKSD